MQHQGFSEFESIRIGNQIWMVSNLNVIRFNNGDYIPEIKSAQEWINAGRERKPAWCYYDNSITHGEKFGKLYNWYAIIDKRGLAPNGWRIPTKRDFELLCRNVNDNGNLLKVKGSGMGDGIGTNLTYFSALFAGDRDNNGNFYDLNRASTFWSLTEESAEKAYHLFLSDMFSYINFYSNEKAYGLSVRCIKD